MQKNLAPGPAPCEPMRAGQDLVAARREVSPARCLNQGDAARLLAVGQNVSEAEAAQVAIAMAQKNLHQDHNDIRPLHNTVDWQEA